MVDDQFHRTTLYARRVVRAAKKAKGIGFAIARSLNLLLWTGTRVLVGHRQMCLVCASTKFNSR